MRDYRRNCPYGRFEDAENVVNIDNGSRDQSFLETVVARFLYQIINKPNQIHDRMISWFESIEPLVLKDKTD